MEFADKEENVVYLAMNGGYFDMATNYSVSLIISDHSLISPN